MFEAYGWASAVEVPDFERLQEQIDRASIPGHSEISLHRDLNHVAVITVAASRNHRLESIIELFRWLASHAPAAHGLLFVRDQESVHSNEYRAWCLIRGDLTERLDPFFSPCIPTIEDPYDPIEEG